MQVVDFNAHAQAELVSRSQAGDAIAFGRIYDVTFPHVYRYAMSLTGCREDAEDLTAETYERALRGIGRYESRDIPILVWLLRIARNVARERRARYMREPMVTTSDRALDQLPALPATQEDALPWDTLLCRLTPSQREVVALRLAGLGGKEIAKTLGKAEGTVKALQFAAIRNLRRAVGE